MVAPTGDPHRGAWYGTERIVTSLADKTCIMPLWTGAQYAAFAEDLVMLLSEDACLPGLQRLPERIVEKAVKGMLPSGRIGRHLFTHLKVQCPF